MTEHPAQPASDEPPPINADEVFARQIHAWLDTHPRTNRPIQHAAERWLVAKGL